MDFLKEKPEGKPKAVSTGVDLARATPLATGSGIHLYVCHGLLSSVSPDSSCKSNWFLGAWGVLWRTEKDVFRGGVSPTYRKKLLSSASFLHCSAAFLLSLFIYAVFCPRYVSNTQRSYQWFPALSSHQFFHFLSSVSSSHFCSLNLRQEDDCLVSWLS